MELVLFEEAAEHVTRISRILHRPRGNALLVGVGGSGKQSLCRLAAFICGFPVHQLALTSTFGLKDLHEFLKARGAFSLFLVPLQLPHLPSISFSRKCTVLLSGFGNVLIAFCLLFPPVCPQGIYVRAGVRPAEPLVFLLPDSHIVDERFLMLINDMLSSGYLPNLFTCAELGEVFVKLRPAAKSAMVQDTWSNLHEFFVDRVRQNLHIVLGLSPNGSSFRTRARQFPALVNCTTIDWFHPWAEMALVSVATTFLERMDLTNQTIAMADTTSEMSLATENNADDAKEGVGSEEEYLDAAQQLEDLRENLAHHMSNVHLSVGSACTQFREVQRRHNYVTPSSFLELTVCFKSLLESQSGKLASDIKRLSIGLERLRSTTMDMHNLQVDLRAKIKKSKEEKARTQGLLDDLGKKRAGLIEQTELAATEQAACDKAASMAATVQATAEGEMDKAKPIIEAAEEAVNHLSKAMLVELKSMTKPPAGVDRVMGAVLMLLTEETNKETLAWDKARKMVAKTDKFKKRLKGYSAERISNAVLNKLAPLMTDKHFTPEKLKNKSEAAAHLCIWVCSMFAFNRIFSKVEPLKAQLSEAKRKKSEADERLRVVQNEIGEQRSELANLQQNFLLATEDKRKVLDNVAQCRERLDRATRLTQGLREENMRWSAEVERMRECQVSVVGDCMLAAAFVSYIAAFDFATRTQLINDNWMTDMQSRDIRSSVDVEPVAVLSPTAERAEWATQGLPTDPMSQQNGAVIANCHRWPVIPKPAP